MAGPPIVSRIVLAWLRVELRRRWRSLVVLALLVALAAGTVLAAVAGARRGATAVERLQAVTLPADVAILPNRPGFDWSAIRALPEVEALTTFPLSGVGIEGIPIGDEAASSPLDEPAMHTIERPVVLDGRLADPRRVDEAVVSSGFVSRYGLGVGDAVTVRLYDPVTLDAAYASSTTPPEPTGPRVPTTIVGVVRSGWFSDEQPGTGQLYPSAALRTAFPAELVGAGGTVPVNALARLRGGEAAMPAFQAALAAASGDRDIEVWNMADLARSEQQADAFEAACLLAFALAALAAAVVLVGQAVTRYTSATVADLQVLRAVGMGRRQALLAACAGPTVVAVAGTAAGVGLAVAASAWFPFGGAAPVEPRPGVDVDLVVLGPGAVLAVLAVVGGAAAAAAVALAPGRAAGPRASALAVAGARAGFPVPVVVGMRFALERAPAGTRHGRGALPVRPALFGAVIGVLGVLAAFTFSAGVADAGANPARFGQTYQLQAYFGGDGEDYFPAHEVLSALAADPDVTGTLDDVNAVVESGGLTVSTHTFDPVGAPLPTVLTTGRMPGSDAEIALAVSTAATLRATVGDTVALTGSAGSGAFAVTGVGFVPDSFHNDYDTGAWLTPGGHAVVSDGFKFHTGLVALVPGADPDVVLPRLAQRAAEVAGAEVPLGPPDPLPQLEQIRRVAVLPVVLGGFLALLAVGAVGHALATAVRRRRHDLAVLRALGMTRRQARALVSTQAGVLAVTGLVFGVPLGIALGRMLWLVVADFTPLQYAPPVALLALLLVGPAALLVAGLLAARPGREAARLRIGHVLRAE